MWKLPISHNPNSFWRSTQKVRVIVGKSGTTVAAGSRVDYVSSSRKGFVGTSPKTLSKHWVEMNGIIASTICQSILEDTECWSRDKKNCPWFKTLDGAKIPVLSRVLISEDLDNSSHIDVNDDTRTFAVFHPSEQKNRIVMVLVSCSWRGNSNQWCGGGVVRRKHIGTLYLFSDKMCFRWMSEERKT